jgi:carbonic anhydrase
VHTKKHHHSHKPSSCRQSPIDLNSNVTQCDHHLHGAALVLDWHATSCIDIVNGGYTWTVHCDDRSSGCARGAQKYTHIALRAPHLDGEYRLAHFHAHWGENATDGSEHTIDGVPMAGEVGGRVDARTRTDPLCAL